MGFIAADTHRQKKALTSKPRFAHQYVSVRGAAARCHLSVRKSRGLGVAFNRILFYELSFRHSENNIHMGLFKKTGTRCPHTSNSVEGRTLS